MTRKKRKMFAFILSLLIIALVVGQREVDHVIEC